MSHVAKYSIGLTGAVSKDLMAIAMSAVAVANGGHVVRGKDAQVKDTYGHTTKVEMSITTKTITNGVGINFTSEGPQWATDSWGKDKQTKTLQAQIKQAYISLVVTTAGKRMGMKSKVKTVNSTLSIELDK